MRRRSLLVLCLVPLLLTACKKDQPQAAGGDAPPVKVGSPITKRLTEWDEYTGRFRAAEHVDVRARVSGYLEAVRFTDGQHVNQGDVLFVIDQRPFNIALDRAEASFQLARKTYERTKLLRESKAVSQHELDMREQEFRVARAALDEARLNIEFSEVTSPVTGRVGRRLVDVGNVVNGADANGTLLTTVVSEDPIYFYFSASEQDLLKYTRLEQRGKMESSRTARRPLYVKLADEKDFAHVGTMDFVDNVIDKATGTIEARAVLSNPDGSLLPGIFGRARIAGSEEYEATLVPDDVVGTNQTQKFVYVVNAENMLESRSVTLGPLHDGGMRIIRDGLTFDDKVVMAGIAMLHPGMKVTPMPMDAPVAVPGKPVEKPAVTEEKNDEEKKPEEPNPDEKKPEAAP